MDVVRLTALSLVILATSALVTWTTDIADVAPATASWGRGPRAGRCPIEDWSVTVASPLRILPMLIDERQVVNARRANSITLLGVIAVCITLAAR